jgi:hypothetical protein
MPLIWVNAPDARPPHGAAMMRVCQNTAFRVSRGVGTVLRALLSGLLVLALVAVLAGPESPDTGGDLAAFSAALAAPVFDSGCAGSSGAPSGHCPVAVPVSATGAGADLRSECPLRPRWLPAGQPGGMQHRPAESLRPPIAGLAVA